MNKINKEVIIKKLAKITSVIKHRKSWSWEYAILISIAVYNFFSLVLFWSRRYVKLLRQFFITFPNTMKFVCNTQLRIIVLTLFCVWKCDEIHSLLYLIVQSTTGNTQTWKQHQTGKWIGQFNLDSFWNEALKTYFRHLATAECHVHLNKHFKH